MGDSHGEMYQYLVEEVAIQEPETSFGFELELASSEWLLVLPFAVG
jgi:hypothetical protein